MTSRGKKLVKMLERLIKQEHLYTSDQLIKMKKQLRSLKEQLNELDVLDKKGFK
tara:strand:+ start:622 stop:783 length:162 start_codon:yes stop_codon:yes gene_type:complete